MRYSGLGKNNSIYVNKIWLWIALAVSCSYLPTASGTDLEQFSSPPVGSESNDERTVIFSLMTDLDAPEAVQRSRAAGILKKYPYREVAHKLMSVLIKELSSNNGNPSVINATIQALKKMPTHDLAGEVKQAISLLEASKDPKISAPETQGAISDSLRNLQSACQTSTRSLPEIQKENEGSHSDDVATFSELVQTLSDNSVDEIYGMLAPGIERVLHDDLLKSSNQVNYSERNIELEKLAQALLRLEKGHVLLTGKAGVGKSTLVKMLQAGYLNRTIPFPGEDPPIIIEMSIIDLTNPKDPTTLRNRINAAKALANKLNRRIILFYDEAHVSTAMSMNAIKSFLTESLGVQSNVHLIWATTSQESRSLFLDSAFSRRWVEVNVPEFTREQAIRAIEKAYVSRWKAVHSRNGISFNGISQEAYEMAGKYAHLEQAHAGNPTGIKELLEGVIIHKLRELEKTKTTQTFTIQPSDIRNYLKYHKGIKLMPGDESFMRDFDELWAKFEKSYVGNDGFKHQQKASLLKYFSTITPDKLMVTLLPGPPGAGKSYFTETIADVFFNTKPLVLNGGDLSTGGAAMENKLLGSPTGFIGSEEQRSRLTKYMCDNPNGGPIVVREADLAHQDFYNFLAELITSKVLVDGLGHEYRMDRFPIYLETNIGQEYLVPGSVSGTQMTWQDLEMRRRSILDTKIINGHQVQTVRQNVLDKIFENFFQKVAKQSNPLQDTALARENNLKMKRRMNVQYVMLPTPDEIAEATIVSFERFKAEAQKEYGVIFELSREDLLRLVDLQNMRFEEGHGWVQSQLDKMLFSKLKNYLSLAGQTVHISLGSKDTKIGRKTITGLALKVQIGDRTETVSLGAQIPNGQNPWLTNEFMRKRINEFPQKIERYIKGQGEQKRYLQQALKEKALNWRQPIVITQIGTSGNGKTELGYGIGEALFDTRDAVFKISGLQRWGDLNNYMRSDVGFVGSTDETEFERWFKTRRSAGGGVIILDELLSFHGLSQLELSERINLINKLYDMLDAQTLRFGARTEDASAFIFLITGNAMQELFDHIDDSPDAEKLTQRIIERISSADIEQYFRKIGLDAPKVARLGKIFVNGPLNSETSKAVALKELDLMITRAIKDLSVIYDVQVQIDPQIIEQVVKRVKTVRLGMRKVQSAIRQIISQPVSEILFDFLGTEKIEAKLMNGRIAWFADDERVICVKNSLTADQSIGSWVKDETHKSTKTDLTPQLSEIEAPPKVILSNEALEQTATHELYGHWMTSYLLTGKNSSEAVSLVPGDDYLGYVRHADTSRDFKLSGLTRWLIDMAILQAGHRAVFLSGAYVEGGGASGRKGEKNRTDDLGKVEEVLDRILSNQILDGFSEFHSHSEKSLFKIYLRTISKGMADRIIRYGKSKKIFSSLFKTLIKNRYLSEREINEVTSTIDHSKIAKLEVLFFWALSGSVVNSLANVERLSKLSPREVDKLRSTAVEILRKTYREFKTINPQASQESLNYIDRLISEASSQIQIKRTNITKSCERFLRRI